MTWYGFVVLVLIIAGIAVLMKALYGGKDSPTPCIGCGACIATGECVYRRNELQRRKQAEALKNAKHLTKEEQKTV